MSRRVGKRAPAEKLRKKIFEDGFRKFVYSSWGGVFTSGLFSERGAQWRQLVCTEGKGGEDGKRTGRIISGELDGAGLACGWDVCVGGGDVSGLGRRQGRARDARACSQRRRWRAGSGT